MAFTDKIDLTLRYLKYWLNAVDDHSLHPPFIYRFYRKVIEPAMSGPDFDDIRDIKRSFLKNKTVLTFEDPGAGSAIHKQTSRTVSEIARSSVSPRKVSRLLYHCGEYLNARHILELGTSLGINVSYLSRLDSAMEVHTIEGVEPIYQLAYAHLKETSNVITHLGSLDELLPGILSKFPKIDLAYIDANHTYEATTRYFDQIAAKRQPSTIIAIGDIHWSEEMEQAWQDLASKDEVTLTIDLFHCGLLFFLPAKEKQHYIIGF